jgi:hypothetical protein
MCGEKKIILEKHNWSLLVLVQKIDRGNEASMTNEGIISF